MSTGQKQVKNETVIFRAPRSVVKSLDRMAEMIGGNRSEALRRLIPDLTPEKESRNEANRQIKELIESSADTDKRTIQEERRSGRGSHIRKKAEEMARRAGL